jgi:hypothetical protein
MKAQTRRTKHYINIYFLDPPNAPHIIMNEDHHNIMELRQAKVLKYHSAPSMLYTVYNTRIKKEVRLQLQYSFGVTRISRPDFLVIFLHNGTTLEYDNIHLISYFMRLVMIFHRAFKSQTFPQYS